MGYVAQPEGGRPMRVALVCTALLGLLVFGLGLGVSLVRGSSQTSFGYTIDPRDRLYKMVRAHANAEFAPMMAILFLVIVWRRPDPPTWMIATIVAATAARYLHAAGMVTCQTLAAPHPLRFVGALGTYVTGLALVVAALLA
jgi:uncharacterized membrane protein YecN with MAPEG domain